MSVPKRLTLVWIALLAGSLGSFWASNAVHGSFVAVMGLAAIKARLIVTEYMDIRRASTGWRTGFDGLVAAVLTGVLAMHFTR